MLSTKTKEITLSVSAEQYISFAFLRGLEASRNFNTSAILTRFSNYLLKQTRARGTTSCMPPKKTSSS